MDRKTTTILVAAGGLVAAAVALGRTRPADHPPRLPTGGPVTSVLSPTGACTLDGAPQARGSAPFDLGKLDAALSQGKLVTGADGSLYMAVDLAIAEQPGAARTPVNMAIVIDHSGSMAGDKIVAARSAARGIIERLGPQDRVALIQYDDDAQVLIASTAMDPDGKRRMAAAIDGISDDGGTNLHGGMMLGIEEARRAMGGERINRVVLLSDGQANVGVVDPQAIARAAGDASDQGIRVTSVGLGIDYNEDLMEAIAENGRGQYYYVKDSGQLEQVFAGELRNMQNTVATGAELRFEPSCAGVEIVDAAGWRSRRDGSALVVPLSDLFGGDNRKVLVKLRAPTALRGAAHLAQATLVYTDKATGKSQQARLALSIEVTDDAQAARASANPEVMAKVEQVEAAQVMREATARYEAGDRAGAQQVLRVKRAETQQRQKEYNLAPAAVAPAMEEMDKMDQGVGAFDAQSEDGKMLRKGGKAKARDMSRK
jgi:Ca-activated chloride channel family protein